VRRPALVTLTTISAWTASGLLLDAHVGQDGQLVLGVLTACLLAVLLALHPRTVRVQALAVVAIATVGEVVGSLIWGLYDYRFENLPAYVPPGHGLVYLAGVSLATLSARRPWVLLGAACVGAAVWGVGGLTILPTTDVAGAVGCGFLLAVLLVTRRAVYAGVFVVVAVLELYGTALGTWTWASTVPGLDLSQGNPPSGVASGYVVFDVVALAMAARVGAASSYTEALAQSIRRRTLAPSVGLPAAITSRAASTLSQTSQSRKPRGLPSSST
jgi:hypothetical protein